MPYIVQAGGPDDRSVSKEFLPPISTQFKARLSSPRALAPEERASLPRTLLVGPPERGGLPGVLGWSTGAFIVSEAVRDIIEELEPGVQEFVPLEVRSKDDVAIAGNTNHSTYYLILSPPPKLKCVVIEETDFKRGRGWQGFIGERPPIDLRAAKQCTLSGNAIAGHHFWRGVGPFEFVYFCSDELRERLQNEKLDGLSFRKKCQILLGAIRGNDGRPSVA